MTRKTAGVLVGAMAFAGALALGPVAAHAATPGLHGCVAISGPQSTCTFTGNGDPNGGYGALSSSWSITHTTTGPNGLTIVVTDAAGTAPAALAFTFATGVVYTVTAGNGSVAAGSAQ